MYKTYYIYIMSNTNNTVLYIGITNDLVRRVTEHRSFSVPGFTQRYCCDKLVYYEEYSDVEQAIYREKQLKDSSLALRMTILHINPQCHPECHDVILNVTMSS